MRLTESKLRQIIREEIALNEAIPANMVRPAPPSPPAGERRTPAGIPPRTDSANPAQKGAPPPPPKTDSAGVIALTPKAKSIANDFMRDVNKQAEEFKKVKEEYVEALIKDFLSSNLGRKFFKNFRDQFSSSDAGTIIAAMKKAMKVDRKTGKFSDTPDDRGAVAFDTYFDDVQMRLEAGKLDKMEAAKTCARILGSIPVRLRMEFKKAGIQQP